MSEGAYDAVIAGTGFASTFFLHRFLELAPAGARVLVLEKGADHDHAWYVEHQGGDRRPGR